jgi:hypothetical protein
MGGFESVAGIGQTFIHRVAVLSRVRLSRSRSGTRRSLTSAEGLSLRALAAVHSSHLHH